MADMSVRRQPGAEGTVTTAAPSPVAPDVRRRPGVWQRFRRHRVALVGAIILLVLTAASIGAPVLAGNGVASLVGPAPALGDSWLIGADIRQTRFSFNVTGPELLGALTLANIELEWGGGNQITSVPAAPTIVPHKAIRQQEKSA